MRIIATVAAVLSLACALPVTAAERGAATSGMTAAQQAPAMQQRFRRIDANADGSLTWKEAEVAREAEFKRLDRNHDGMLTPDEFTGRALPFAAFDANRDGKMSMSEYVAKHQQMFERADIDRSGTLSLAEFIKAQQVLRSTSGSR